MGRSTWGGNGANEGVDGSVIREGHSKAPDCEGCGEMKASDYQTQRADEKESLGRMIHYTAFHQQGNLFFGYNVRRT